MVDFDILIIFQDVLCDWRFEGTLEQLCAVAVSPGQAGLERCR